MRAELGDPPVLDDRHTVGVVRREETVGDRDHRATVQHSGEGAFEMAGRGIAADIKWQKKEPKKR